MGYNKSTLKTFVESDQVWGKFPEALKNILKQTRVYSNIGRLSSDIEECYAKIYPLSLGDLDPAKVYYGEDYIKNYYLKETGTNKPL